MMTMNDDDVYEFVMNNIVTVEELISYNTKNVWNTYTESEPLTKLGKFLFDYCKYSVNNSRTCYNRSYFTEDAILITNHQIISFNVLHDDIGCSNTLNSVTLESYSQPEIPIYRSISWINKIKNFFKL